MEDSTLAALILILPILIVLFILYRIGYFKNKSEVIDLDNLKWHEAYKSIQDPTPEKIPDYYPGSDYQELFNHMSEEHGLTLLESEMDEIIHISGRYLDKNPIQNITRKF